MRFYSLNIKPECHILLMQVAWFPSYPMLIKVDHSTSSFDLFTLIGLFFHTARVHVSTH